MNGVKHYANDHNASKFPDSIFDRGVATEYEECKNVCYGELTFLGYNGGLNPSRPFSKHASHKFYIFRKNESDGVQATELIQVVKTPNLSKAVRSSELHSVCYTIAREKNVVVQYELDKCTDKYQIGRSLERPIDILLTDDVVDGSGVASSHSSPVGGGGSSDSSGVCPGVGGLLTVSRYACRLQAHRDTAAVRLYAAGFDQHGNIFLGCKAHKWQTNNGYDGLTTNGVLLSQPVGGEFFNRDSSAAGGTSPGPWREVSINGNVYSRRIASRSAKECGSLVPGEDNLLRDGAVIDLCGATFLFRTSETLNLSPTKWSLEQSLARLNAGRPQCPVTLQTLIIPRRGVAGGGAAGDGVAQSNSAATSTAAAAASQPYVYVKCGHVQGKHEWGNEQGGLRKCPMCEQVGPVIKLCLGYEPSFYVDDGSLCYAFNPCGHITTCATVRYWSAFEIPKGDVFTAACPFCLTDLDRDLPSMRLIFQDYTD